MKYLYLMLSEELESDLLCVVKLWGNAKVKTADTKMIYK